MKTFHKTVFFLVSALGSITMHAQQEPMFTHYMDNTLLVNPGYAGSRDALTVTALDRSQWVDFKGAPVTQTLTLHTPLRNEHIGVGLSVLNDKIGPVNNTTIMADFAYIMKVSPKAKLSFGVSGGVSMFQANLSTLNLDQQSDPVFQNSISNHMTPTVGFGIYYYRERFYAGLSSANLLENNYSVTNSTNGNTLTSSEQRHYYFIAGTVINLNDILAFKPTALVKFTVAAPVQADVTASFIIMKRFLIGAMFRSGDAVGGLIGVNITEQLHLGYSYDWSYGLQTSRYNMGSHEIMLRYDFIFFDKKQIHSPRYF